MPLSIPRCHDCRRNCPLPQATNLNIIGLAAIGGYWFLKVYLPLPISFFKKEPPDCGGLGKRSMRRTWQAQYPLTSFPILHILGAIYSDDGKEYAPPLTQRDAGRWKAFQSGAEGGPGAPGLKASRARRVLPLARQECPRDTRGNSGGTADFHGNEVRPEPKLVRGGFLCPEKGVSKPDEERTAQGL